MDPNRLSENKTLCILRAAHSGNYSVIAAVGYNLEQILGLVKAAEREKSPLIIQLLPWAITHSDGVLVYAAAQAARQASVPIALHLSHCQDEDMVRRGCGLPFDSIMVDSSDHAEVRDFAKTKELVAYCHSHGKATTVEPQAIEEI
ncbi:hypothetical protein TrVGV298_004447 [Trichoderma virens]|nr:hypothetical protein TrVGV298_004447 [Trichoderma virens]